MLCLFVANVCGQQFAFTNYSISNGLPSNNILKVFQDSNGRLWLGTMNGLVYFEGSAFHTFDKNQIVSNNPVRVIFEDNNNNIWFGTSRQGLCRYSGTKFSIFNTEAPNSAKNKPTLGPAKTLANSITFKSLKMVFKTCKG